MTDEFDYLLWAYRATVKQTNVGGGSVTIKVTSTERVIILYGGLGPNDWAADRTIQSYVSDGTNKISQIMPPSALDNEFVPLIASGSATIAANTASDFERRIVLGAGDELVIVAGGFIQNEELDLAIRALALSFRPTVSAVGGTPTITEDYNKVI